MLVFESIRVIRVEKTRFPYLDHSDGASTDFDIIALVLLVATISRFTQNMLSLSRNLSVNHLILYPGETFYVGWSLGL
jgi:hypothetical protein